MYLVQIRKIVRKTKRSGYWLNDGKTSKVEGITIVNTTGEKMLVDRKTTNKKAKSKKK